MLGREAVAGVPVETAAVTTTQAPVAALGALTSRRPKKHLRADERLTLWLSRLVIIVFMCLVLFPALWVVASSFQGGILFNSTNIIPTSFTLQHYHDLFANTSFLTWVRNSIIVCTSVGIMTVLLVATMAYAFSRFKFAGRKYGLMFLLLVQMFPAQMSFIAFYYLLLQLHLTRHASGADSCVHRRWPSIQRLVVQGLH